ATALRHAHPALRRGSYRTLLAREHTYVFERVHEEEHLVVAFNVGTTPSAFTLAVPGTRLAPRFGNLPAMVVEEKKVDFNLPPRSGAVWEVEA
ncbi:MAG: alpha-glucosidase C-terminal domain-containing protein, partial [Ardenticatenales bacterium]|nr:alpha-glucosidase C-terminal domain-containing protein [Ardenticatenales bacterium]